MEFIKNNRAALVLILIAICFIVIGVFDGEVQIVIRKAINVCMECIGLG